MHVQGRFPLYMHTMHAGVNLPFKVFALTIIQDFSCPISVILDHVHVLQLARCT